MPLIGGKKAKTKAGISENIRREVHAGKPQKQAHRDRDEPGRQEQAEAEDLKTLDSAR